VWGMRHTSGFRTAWTRTTRSVTTRVSCGATPTLTELRGHGGRHWRRKREVDRLSACPIAGWTAPIATTVEHGSPAQVPALPIGCPPRICPVADGSLGVRTPVGSEAHRTCHSALPSRRRRVHDG